MLVTGTTIIMKMLNKLKIFKLLKASNIQRAKTESYANGNFYEAFITFSYTYQHNMINFYSPLRCLSTTVSSVTDVIFPCLLLISPVVTEGDAQVPLQVPPDSLPGFPHASFTLVTFP